MQNDTYYLNDLHLIKKEPILISNLLNESNSILINNLVLLNKYKNEIKYTWRDIFNLSLFYKGLDELNFIMSNNLVELDKADKQKIVAFMKEIYKNLNELLKSFDAAQKRELYDFYQFSSTKRLDDLLNLDLSNQ